MLFIENYDAKSLDRSSVSMIDKYNGRLNIVGMFLTRLSALIDNLLSLIRDIRNTLGQCKQRVYDNLKQVKEVVKGNKITGTEGTISAIEDALKAGDEAIAKAEARLEGVQQEISGTSTQPVNKDCGEPCGQTPTIGEVENCTFCNYNNTTIECSAGQSFDGINVCSVCNHGECVVDVSCNEPPPPGPVGYDPKCDQYWGGVPDDPTARCSQQSIVDPTCHEAYSKDTECNQYTCTHSNGCAQQIPDNCPYSCTHSTECHESPMPEDCTYTCADNGCTYGGTDCSYGSVCGQGVVDTVCGQTASDLCGEPCGETCHMTAESSKSGGGCSEGSCGESSCGDCGQQGCDETGTEQGCAEGSCGEGSCGML